jgi:hypothetical protein
MASGRMRRRRTAAAAVALALAVPAVALAGGPIGGGPAGGLSYFFGYTTMSSNGGSSGVAAQCPSPMHTIGGGFDSDTGSLNGRLYESTPHAADSDGRPNDGWRVGATDLRSENADLNAYAICSTDRVKYRSVTGGIKAGRARTLTATCPDGTRGTAGGLDTDGFPLVTLSAVYPVDGPDANAALDDGWAVRAFNPGTTKVTVTARAICVVGVKTQYLKVNLGIGGNTTFGFSAPICGADGFLTGGGAQPKDPLKAKKARITAMVPSDIGGADEPDTVPDDRLTFEAANDDIATGGTISYYTVCLIR